jgi:hypothetical protein
MRDGLSQLLEALKAGHQACIPCMHGFHHTLTMAGFADKHLVLYNTLQFCGWAAVLWVLITRLATNPPSNGTLRSVNDAAGHIAGESCSSRTCMNSDVS